MDRDERARLRHEARKRTLATDSVKSSKKQGCRKEEQPPCIDTKRRRTGITQSPSKIANPYERDCAFRIRRNHAILAGIVTP